MSYQIFVYDRIVIKSYDDLNGFVQDCSMGSALAVLQ